MSEAPGTVQLGRQPGQSGGAGPRSGSLRAVAWGERLVEDGLDVLAVVHGGVHDDEVDELPAAGAWAGTALTLLRMASIMRNCLSLWPGQSGRARGPGCGCWDLRRGVPMALLYGQRGGSWALARGLCCC